jgi:hypothetical protein
VNKRANKIVKIVDGPTQMSRRRRRRSRFAPAYLSIPSFIPQARTDRGPVNESDEAELSGQSVARGGRAPPGSNGASPYRRLPVLQSSNPPALQSSSL